MSCSNQTCLLYFDLENKFNGIYTCPNVNRHLHGDLNIIIILIIANFIISKILNYIKFYKKI